MTDVSISDVPVTDSTGTYIPLTDLSMSLDDALSLRHELARDRKNRIIWYVYTAITYFLIFLWLFSNFFLALLLFIVWMILYVRRNRKHALQLEVYAGLPGSGKTTMCAYFTKLAHKLGIPTYTNVPVAGAFNIDPNKDLGKYHIHDAQILIDEAGICWNNRNYSKFPMHVIEWLKLHRHYKCSVKVFSQSYNDMDVTVRRLAYRFFILRRSLIPGVFCAIPVRRSIGINEMTQEICDVYRFDPPILRLFTTKRFVGRKYWHMFDSYDAPELPEKQFERWVSTDYNQSGAKLKAETML